MAEGKDGSADAPEIKVVMETEDRRHEEEKTGILSPGKHLKVVV